MAKSIKDDFALVLNDPAVWTFDDIPFDFLQPARQEGSGVTINNSSNDTSYVFMSGFFEGGNELRLIARDGQIISRWPVRYSEHFPTPSHLIQPPVSDWKIDLHGSVLNPNGSVVFNYEYGGTVKLTHCGEVEWVLPHQTHHSVVRTQSGEYWIPGRQFLFSEELEHFPPFSKLTTDWAAADDLILLVNQDGQIIEEKSVAGILYDNGLKALLTSSGQSLNLGDGWDEELTHVNKIAVLGDSIADAFFAFDAGDLAVSIRQYNLVFVVDPQTWKIKWHQTGPWLRQHDPEFEADGSISIFNNNAYRTAMLPSEKSDLEAPLVSNIIKVFPDLGINKIAYGDSPQQGFLSVIRGKQDPTFSGGYLITEFEAGRIFEVDVEGSIIWEYVNRFDETRVAEITEAQLYQANYFTIENWECSEK